MGFTVTTNLGLIKPDINDKIKQDLPTYAGWAAQNTINMDKIDALFRAASASYTPTFTADTTSPTLGTGGSVTGKFIRLYPRMVLVDFRVFAGTASFVAGSGTYRVSLPTGVAAAYTSPDDILSVGKASFFDASSVVTSSNLLVCYQRSTNNLFFRPSVGGIVTAASPVAMANNDRISGYAFYPTDDA